MALSTSSLHCGGGASTEPGAVIAGLRRGSGRTELFGEWRVEDAKLEGGWGFYEFDGPGSAKVVKRPAGCYECHEGHAAVDTTFVPFYPTLLPLAKTKGTLSPVYLKEIGAATGSK